MAKTPFNREYILVDHNINVHELTEVMFDGLTLDNLAVAIHTLKEKHGSDAMFILENQGCYEDCDIVAVVTVQRLETEKEHDQRLKRHDRGVIAAQAKATRRKAEKSKAVESMQAAAKKLGFTLVKAP